MNRVLLIAITMICTIATMAGIAYAWPGLVVRSTNPILIRSCPLMAPLLATSIAMVMARSALKSPAFPSLAYGVIFGTFTNAILLIGAELERLHPYFKTAAWPIAALPYIDSFALTGIGLSMMMAGILYLILKQQRAPTRRGRLSPKRSFHAYHGDAEWMDLARAAKLFPPGGPIVLGERYRPDLDRSITPTFDPTDRSTWGKGHEQPLLTFDGSIGSGHGLVFAGPGSFKTTGVVIPNLLTWLSSTVILDPSTQVFPMVKRYRRSLGHVIHVIDPDDPATSFNVLDWIHDNGQPEENIAFIAEWIVADEAEMSSGSDEFFREQGRELITALLADVALSPEYDALQRNLRTLRQLLALPEKKLREHIKNVHATTPSSFIRDKLGPFVNLASDTFSGVYSNAAKATRWLSFERYADLVSSDGFKSQELRNGNTDVFINIDLKTLSAHPGLIRVIYGALLNSVYDGDPRTNGKVLFLTDEAITLGRLKIIETARDEGRKYGITLLMIYQSLGQLLDIWGRNAQSKWFEATSYRSFSAINDPDLAKTISEMCGHYTIEIDQLSISRGSNSRGGALSGGSSRTRSRSINYQRKALIEPNELLADMRTDEQIIFVTGQSPLRCSRAIWFRRDDMKPYIDPDPFIAK
ncbi:type IV secretory system conjugative DNA transfer family protein [Sphingobium sp. DEHP117]|uniref:type IV secretory system conjugative DNA transfer family protein n=1 Tax=Sphingobium sp. DEHP117 TaxID=2993436 RepID=UPI0027D66FD8|nr:type IV secretory system conjugative DNA transfer family protein [Sphingobium sp. DEHP117]MDQ4422149.1 type IV secretory system conjugative DNA transfer family protein [Sphingobium sp. DEHP117]